MKQLVYLLAAAILVVAFFAALAIYGLGSMAPTQTSTVPPTGTSTSAAVRITYNATLAAEGKNYFINVFSCVSCHSIRSLGIQGGAVGPDLSNALLDGKSPYLGRWYSEHGLADPASNPEEAAKLLAQFLVNPPSYAPTMRTNVNAWAAQYGQEWSSKYVPALVELLREAEAAYIGGK